jgi:dinuclear metal center YbgI/SA1388 family protein
MTTIAEVTNWLEQFAPASLAEPWDNVGLIWGDPAASVERIMTCLTVTPTTADEAIISRAELIVSHHPILFREVKKIRADWPATGYLWKLAREGIAVASPHTAFDNTRNGINDLLCTHLGLLDVASLRPAPGLLVQSATAAPQSFKVVVFTPEGERDAVSSAAFHSGAGRIGAYEECSFAIPGEGTFFGTETTNPTIGERGQRETVRELRLEFVCPSPALGAVLEAIRANHSYEEPAIDVYPLHHADPAANAPPGVGRIGRLGKPRSLAELARDVGQALATTAVGAAGDLDRRVERLAIACGAGDDFLKDAARAGADALLTGEARFHRGIEAETLGIGLIVAGHYATERPGVEFLAAQIGRAFPALLVWPSRLERDAFRVFGEFEA